jgi:hypothetical protein
MSHVASFINHTLPRTLRTSLTIFIGIAGAWAVWIVLSLTVLGLGAFAAVGNGDGLASTAPTILGTLSTLLGEVLGNVLIICTLIGFFLVCGMNLLYLCRFWDQLSVKRKAVSGFLFSATSLPFLFIAFGLLMRLLDKA